jgi:RNA polymerase sigma-70 factor (ECF subfamily)
MGRPELARERFDALYREHGQPLYAYLAWSVGDRSLAEDLLADVFERALRNRRRFDPRRGSEKTWLYAIAVNRARDHMRRAASEGRAIERLRSEAALAAVAARRLHDSPITKDVDEALGTLTLDEREVIALRFGADLTIEQVARALGESKTTVEGRLYRALRKLQDTMNDA